MALGCRQSEDAFFDGAVVDVGGVVFLVAILLKPCKVLVLEVSQPTQHNFISVELIDRCERLGLIVYHKSYIPFLSKQMSQIVLTANLLYEGIA